MQLKPIGVVRSPYTEPKGMPIQPAGAESMPGAIEVLEEYRDGLQDLDGFSHILVLSWLHLSEGYDLKVVPFLDTKQHGVFATRSPRRPNPIGLSVLRLDRIEDGVLHVFGVDMVDGTPVLDIKPYTRDFDEPPEVRVGWLEGVDREAIKARRADDRFGGSSPTESGGR